MTCSGKAAFSVGVNTGGSFKSYNGTSTAWAVESGTVANMTNFGGTQTNNGGWVVEISTLMYGLTPFSELEFGLKNVSGGSIEIYGLRMVAIGI